MYEHCFACKEPKKLTSEHIIPQAIGGRLTAPLYCKECNDTFGQTIDNEISKQFGYIGTFLNIEMERTEIQPFVVKEISSDISLVFDGKKFQRKNPIIEISKTGQKVDFINITARNKKELKQISASMKKRYDLPEEMRTFDEIHEGPIDVTREIEIDNSLLRRAVSKIAYNFLCYKVPQSIIFSSAFENIRSYIKNGGETDLASANFIHTQFMVDNLRPLHKIHLALNRETNILAGYILIFGIFRFTVLLSDSFISQFEWPDLDYTYDPVHRQEVLFNKNFRAPSLSKENILHPKQPRGKIEAELIKAYNVAFYYIDNMEFSGGHLTKI